MKISKKRFLLLPAIVLLLSLLTAAAFADEELSSTGTWDYLVNAVSNAETDSTITLYDDYVGDDSVDRLLVETGKTLTIDLNGHTIDRNRTTVDENGHVIVVQAGATLKIKDSSGDNSGVITGGYAYNGGGINNSGTLIIEGGTITGNTAVQNGTSDGRGGGIANYGTLTITGGVITNNTAYAGGGIGIRPGGTADPCVVNITGGSITNNTAEEGGAITTANNELQIPLVTLENVTISGNKASGSGGAIRMWDGTITINSGTISGNEAMYAGAIQVAERGVLKLYGGTISGNTASKQGGAILVIPNGAVWIKDSPVIHDNTAASGSNVYLRPDTVLTVVGPLGEDARIGVTIENDSGNVTERFGEFCKDSDAACFISDSSDYVLSISDGEQREVVLKRVVSYVERSWDGSAVVSETAFSPDSVKRITDGFQGTPTVELDWEAYSGNQIITEGGWYYVTGNVTVDGKLVFAGSGTTHLILCDDAKLLTAGVYVAEGTTLTIYGQENDTGALSGYSENNGDAGIGGPHDYVAGSIVIHGGTVSGHGGTNGAGIGGGEDNSGYQGITIYGGTINAVGGSSGAGIGKGEDNSYNCGPIHIYGGNIYASCGDNGDKNNAAGIGGSESSNGGVIEIYGGKIRAYGGQDGAGIGGGKDGEGHQSITISGGDIEAYGGDSAAGIGNGYDSSSVKVSITINGGHVEAYAGIEKKSGGRAGAAIGGGASASTSRVFQGSITITGGDILAKSEESGAGIGSGKDSPLKGSIRITGGIVHAISGNNQTSPFINSGAGIGSGAEADVESEGSIVITGGTVIAESFSNMITGAGIGSGGKSNMKGTIEISGGTVTATSRIISSEPGAGAGIGAGKEHDYGSGGECSGTVNITGGTVIASTNDDKACAIGYGSDGDETGTRRLYHTAKVTAGSSEANASLRPYNSRVVGFGEMYCRIEPCDHAERTYTLQDPEVDGHVWHCKYCLSVGDEAHTYNGDNVCTVCDYQGETVTVGFAAGNENASGAMDSQTVVKGAEFILPDCGFLMPEGQAFKEWSVKIGSAEAVSKQPGDTITVTENTTVTAVWETLTAPAFATQSLILSGRIGVTFYMKLPTLEGVNYNTSRMTFTIPHGPVTESVGYSEGKWNAAHTYYGFTCYINSIQMAEPITATFHYYENDTEKTITKEFAAAEYFSAFDEAVRAGTITDETMIRVVEALADYGHYVQPFLADARGWTVGTEYAEMDKYYTNSDNYNFNTILFEVSSKELTVTGTDADIAEVRHSLTLDSDTVINVYFKPADSYGGTFMAAVDGGEATAYSIGSDGRYCVKIKSIAAHELSTAHTITVTTANGSITVTVSALSYVNSALNYYNDANDADRKARNAAAAIWAYSKAADAYKAAHSNG